MFFAKYDLDGDGILDMNEGNQVVNDLDSDHIDRDVSNLLFKQKYRICSYCQLLLNNNIIIHSISELYINKNVYQRYV